MHTSRNLTLDDFYLLDRQHTALPANLQDEEEEEEYDDEDEEAEDEEEGVLVVEGGDEDEEDDAEDEDYGTVEAGQSDTQDDSVSVRRLMISSRPRRRRSPAALRPQSASPAPRRSGTRGG